MNLQCKFCHTRMETRVEKKSSLFIAKDSEIQYCSACGKQLIGVGGRYNASFYDLVSWKKPLSWLWIIPWFIIWLPTLIFG